LIEKIFEIIEKSFFNCKKYFPEKKENTGNQKNLTSEKFDEEEIKEIRKIQEENSNILKKITNYKQCKYFLIGKFGKIIENENKKKFSKKKIVVTKKKNQQPTLTQIDFIHSDENSDDDENNFGKTEEKKNLEEIEELEKPYEIDIDRWI
jgi:hypothetical protein